MRLKKGTVKKAVISTIEMEIAISKYFGIREHIIVPNISWGFKSMHECDLFIIKKSGIAIEVEIKRTKSDLIADFKKSHHHKDRDNRITEFYFAIPEELYEKCNELIPEGAGIILCYKYTDPKKKTEEVGAYVKKKSQRIKGSRKLTVEERLRIAHLGTMRIWSLKQKLLKIK